MNDLYKQLMDLNTQQKNYILEDVFLELEVEAEHGDQLAIDLIKRINKKVVRWEGLNKRTPLLKKDIKKSP